MFLEKECYNSYARVDTIYSLINFFCFYHIYLYRVAKCTKHQYEGLVRNIVVLAAIAAVVVVGTGRRSARPLIVVTAGSGSCADIREIVLLSAYHHRGLLLLSTRLHPSLIHPHHYEPTQTKTCLALERYSLASLSQL